MAHWSDGFSRHIRPIPCNSHNDYWRGHPLSDALGTGCTGVEADVWLTGGGLLVGHDRKSLTHKRTLRSLYIDPLVIILTGCNYLQTQGNASGPPNGVFEVNRTASLTLLIDIKSNGPLTFPVVLEQLEPLRAKGWLTHFNSTDVIQGPRHSGRHRQHTIRSRDGQRNVPRHLL